jgi:hypothetical protein
MMNDTWVLLDEVAGYFQAEIFRGVLEAQGIPVFLSQEGAGHALSLTVGPLGTVQILVPGQYLEAARQLVEDYYAGKLEGENDNMEEGWIEDSE